MNSLLIHSRPFFHLAALWMALCVFCILPSLQVFSGGAVSVAVSISSIPFFCLLLIERRFAWLKHPVWIWLLGLSILACLSFLWSINPQHSQHVAHIFFNTVFPAIIFVSGIWYLSQNHAKTFAIAIIGGYLLGFLFLGEEYLTHGFVTKWWRLTLGMDHKAVFAVDYLNKSIQFMTPYTFVVAAISLRWVKPSLLWLAGLVFLALISQLNCMAGVVGIILGALVFILYFISKGRILIFFIMMLVITPICIPFMMMMIDDSWIKELGTQLPLSSLHRLLVWQRYASHLHDALPWGLGMGSTDLLDTLKQLPQSLINANIDRTLRHPHNMWFQLYLELGFLGVILYTGLVIQLMLSIHRFSLPISYRGLCMAALVSYLFENMVDYDIWRDRWITAAFVCIAAVGVGKNIFQSRSKPTP